MSRKHPIYKMKSEWKKDLKKKHKDNPGYGGHSDRDCNIIDDVNYYAGLQSPVGFISTKDSMRYRESYKEFAERNKNK